MQEVASITERLTDASTGRRPLAHEQTTVVKLKEALLLAVLILSEQRPTYSTSRTRVEETLR